MGILVLCHKLAFLLSSTVTEDNAAARSMEATVVALAGNNNINATINPLGCDDINNLLVRSRARGQSEEGEVSQPSSLYPTRHRMMSLPS